MAPALMYGLCGRRRPAASGSARRSAEYSWPLCWRPMCACTVSAPRSSSAQQYVTGAAHPWTENHAPASPSDHRCPSIVHTAAAWRSGSAFASCGV